MIDRLHTWLCQFFCGHAHTVVDDPHIRDAQEVRDTSHDLANSAARIQGMASEIKKEAETIESFSRALRR